jgi:hypothetical protein
MRIVELSYLVILCFHIRDKLKGKKKISCLGKVLKNWISFVFMFMIVKKLVLVEKIIQYLRNYNTHSSHIGRLYPSWLLGLGH